MSGKIAIIGAGVAGLAAGCYAQMNGYQSHIFELHDIPGGLCTAWERKGYIIDGCIHYLFGSGAGQPFHRMWEELGAVQTRTMIDHDMLLQVCGEDGRTLRVYCDPARLEDEITGLSPTDARLAHELAEGVRRFAAFDMTLMYDKPRPLMTPQDYALFGQRMLPFMLPLIKFGMISARQYMHNGNAGFPAGGSLEFARALERRYLALGGQISYKAQVEQILVTDDAATGVRLYNDEVHTADIVISAADGRSTLFAMLDGR